MIRVACLVLIAPFLAQDKPNEAEVAFRKLADSIENAKSLRVKFEAELTEGEKKLQIKGLVLLKEGNRVRLEGSGPERPALYVCDGKKSRAKDGDRLLEILDAKESVRAETAKVHSSLCSALLATEVQRDLARGREIFGKGQKLVLEKFAFGPKDGENTVITYTATLDQVGKPLDLKIWIDPKGRLVKRSGSAAGVFSFTETFPEWNLEAEIADDQFKLPE